VAALAGCKLVDQSTFAPKPVGPSPEQLAATPDSAKTPLISIHFDPPSQPYDLLLRYAVAQAMLRKPNVAFEVVAVLPKIDTATAQLAAMDQGNKDTEAVVRALREQGIPPDRAILGAEIVPGATGREVRVYVR
jgi:hypothetical protein